MIIVNFSQQITLMENKIELTAWELQEESLEPMIRSNHANLWAETGKQMITRHITHVNQNLKK